MGRLKYYAGSTMLLLGAFAIGAVIHGALVENRFSLLAPVSVVGVLIGLVVIVVGRWLEQRNEGAVLPDLSDDESEEDFDEETSPVDQDGLEKYDRDDSA